MLLFLNVSNYFRLVLLLPLMFFAMVNFAQTSFSKDNFQFEIFSLPGGAMANQVQQVVQDKNGFLWFATKKGLIKYDGRKFTTYLHQSNDSNSIHSNFIESLLFDSKGVLWIGTYGAGVTRFDTDLETFIPVKKINDHLKQFKTIYIYALLEDAQNNIWIGSEEGLFKYNQNTQEFTSFYADKKNPKALQNPDIWKLYLDKNNVVWVGTGMPWQKDTTRGGLHKYNPLSNDFTHFINQPEDLTSLADNRVRAIYEDSKNNFWVGTMGEGLHQMNRIGGIFERFGSKSNPPNALSRPYILDPNFIEKSFSQVTFVHEDKFGRLWIGAFNGGLNIYDPFTKQQLHFEKELGNGNGLPSNYLFNILETQDNSIFLCTGDQGGNIVMKITYSSNFFEKNLLPKKNYQKGYIESIAEDNSGNVWLGTMFGEGLFQWNPNQKTIKKHPSFLKSTNINSLGFDTDGKLWIGYHKNGVQRIDPKDLSIQPLNLPENISQKISSKSINNIFEDSRRNVWIPERLKGVRVLKSDQSVMVLHKDNGQPNAISGTTIDRIKEDAIGHIWLFGNIRSHDGIYSLTIDEYNPTDNITKAYLSEGQENGFISSVDMDKEGNFWFTNGLDGIKKFIPKTGLIKTINTSNSRIPTSEILALLVAQDGIIWMSAKDKIISYNPINESIRIFGALDGVSIELSNGSIYERKNGNILFGGRNGFLELNPDNLAINEQSKKNSIRITEIKINNENISIESHILSAVPIWEKEKITLTHSERDFSFGLSSVDYHVKDNDIEYFLENYDTYWRRVGPEQIAYYVNVPAGEYTLRTRGTDKQSGLTVDGSSINIIVKAPWWQTWWAYISYLLIGFGFIYTFYRVQLKRQKEKQEAIKLREIDELKTKLYANITHEFRTPLTLILGYASQIRKESGIKETIHTKAKNIEKSGQQLLHLVNQLLDIRKLESKNESLLMVQGDIVPILNNFTDSFESFAISRGIQYQISLPHPPLVMDYDYDKLQKIIANLISNAIKFTDKGGKVTVFLQRIDNALLINVKDKGIGIAADQIPHIFDRFYRAENSHQTSGTGIGLALTKELVDLMNGTIQVNSTLNRGSNFTVKIPITNTAPTAQNKEYEPLTRESIQNTTVAIIENKEEHKDLPIVLIVEDNADVAQFTASCLKDYYNIYFAIDGQEGIDKALEIIPDIIISDVMMPYKDGFELCQELKSDEKTSHIPIILLTAKADIEDRLVGLERGADAYLSKPFHERELKIRIQQLIQLREKLKERYAGLNLKKPSTDKSLQLDDAFVLKVRQAIEDHLDEQEFGVEELSKAIFLSRAQVHRKIKALTGKSTGQFMHTIRLHHALQFLQDTDKSITVIAFDVGYNDPSYFTRMFTREFGNPPSFYAKNV